MPPETDAEPRTKTVRITCPWETHHDIEVPEDWRVPGTLDGFPEEALEEMRCDGTESLIDWA